MKSAGASVLTGITLTKLVGVSVLAIAPSLLFRVYYFRMYMATVAVGAFQVRCFSRSYGLWLRYWHNGGHPGVICKAGSNLVQVVAAVSLPSSYKHAFSLGT